MWHWAEGWTKESIGTDNERSGEKYADLGLYDDNDKCLIPLRIDHFDIIFDARRSTEMIPHEVRRLIELAPELLRALKELREWSKSEYQNNPAIDTNVDLVIAMAEGKI
jgi:hypothetical protein